MILVNWEEDAKMIVKNFSRKEMERLNAIIAMDIMVRNMNNESAYFTWIYLVPDCANEYDFIAKAFSVPAGRFLHFQGLMFRDQKKPSLFLSKEVAAFSISRTERNQQKRGET